HARSAEFQTHSSHADWWHTQSRLAAATRSLSTHTPTACNALPQCLRRRVLRSVAWRRKRCYRSAGPWVSLIAAVPCSCLHLEQTFQVEYFHNLIRKRKQPADILGKPSCRWDHQR